MHRCMGWTGSFVPAHSSETSADKRVDLPPIYPPHLHLRVRSVLDFALFGKLVRPEYALYAVSVRRAGSLLRTSFRFHLTMDTLVFRLQFLLTSLYRTFTDESTHMPRILKNPPDCGRGYPGVKNSFTSELLCSKVNRDAYLINADGLKRNPL